MRVAQNNAISLGVSTRSKWVHADWFHSPDDSFVGKQTEYQLIIANPPYVKSECVKDLPFEPSVALDGGIDGLDAYRKLADLERLYELMSHDRPSYLVIECGKDQWYLIKDIVEKKSHQVQKARLMIDKVEKDLGGVDRVLVFRWV